MKTRASVVAVAAGLALAAALSAGGAGCSSGGGKTDGGGGGGGGGATGSGTISWQDDATPHQTTFATASLVTSGGIRLLQVAGGEASGIGIALGVTGMPTIAPGTFGCGPADGGYPITSFSYTAPGVDAVPQECTISITSLGAATGEPVTGTFFAGLKKTGGGDKAISAGVFNVPLNVSP